MKRDALLFITGLVLAAVIGCGDPPEEAVSTRIPSLSETTLPGIAPAVSAPAFDILQLPELAGDKQRDPFRAHVRRVEPPEFLELDVPIKGKAFSLDELSLVGVVEGDVEPVAMFRNPRGRGYMARRGDYLSRSVARIKLIQKDKVVVEFPFRKAGARGERIIKLDTSAPAGNSEDTWRYSR